MWYSVLSTDQPPKPAQLFCIVGDDARTFRTQRNNPNIKISYCSTKHNVETLNAKGEKVKKKKTYSVKI
jgi:hypothetical protein